VKIQELFLKPIDRNIEGVIKADNDTELAIKQEIEEYVVTKELNQRLDDFFRFYAQTIEKPTTENGVWISGFFGSGKSHLLKILSYILSNKLLSSSSIAKIFEEKIDQDDFELRANINKSLSVEAETILFNIDQKAEALSVSQQDDKLLAVFAKVFYEQLGFYGKSTHVAMFELNLYDDGVYEEFKKEFDQHCSREWTKAREALALYKEPTAKALSTIRQIPIEDAKKYIDSIKDDFSLSIEEFAIQVNEYISKKSKNFRLIFCVDEIGQYIGDNSKLMLNLQTITESLATKCSGKAWVIVTSQQDIDQLIEMNSGQSNDFSKIMGRFKIKINLTSKDANEVIEKRLLAKTDDACVELDSIYQKHNNTLRSILHFEGKEYRVWNDPSNFIATYPFVPYQFTLFQESIRGLSAQSAFQGSHQSVGERSMLGVFQDVLKAISSKDTNLLASYDLFFDGLRSTIKGEIQASISIAEKSINDEFALRVLKALFMIKYVKFTPTLDNIATLLVSSFDENIAELKEKLKAALEKLENQIYIQRIGDNFEYLSDKEKDIENEIKATSINESDITTSLKKLLFDELLSIDKVRYEPNKYDYKLELKMDGNRVKGVEENVILHCITPRKAYEYSEDKLLHLSMSNNEVIVWLGESKEFDRALEVFVKTEKFIPQKHSAALSDSEKTLLQQKGNQNRERRSKLIANLKLMMESAKFYFNGNILTIPAKDPESRVKDAVNQAIGKIFPSLIMLGNKNYSEQSVKECLMNVGDLDMGDDALCEPEQEMLSRLSRLKQEHKTPVVSELIDIFGNRPYGWYPMATASILAMLCAKGKIELKQNSNVLDKTATLRALTNNREQSSAYVVLAKAIDDGVTKKISKNIAELFDLSTPAVSAKELYAQAREQSKELAAKLQGYKDGYRYEFLGALDKPIESLRGLASIGYDEFYESGSEFWDSLLDAKDDTIAPIKEFMNGSQHDIYKSVKNWLVHHRDNLHYLSDDGVSALQELLMDSKPFIGGKIQTAKTTLTSLEDELQKLTQEKIKIAQSAMEAKIVELQTRADFARLDQGGKNKALSEFLATKDRILASDTINMIMLASSSEYLGKMYTKALEIIDELLPADESKQEPKKQKQRLYELEPKGYSTLQTPEQVESFIAEFRQSLLEAVKEQKEIVI